MHQLFVYGTLRPPVGGPAADTHYYPRIVDGVIDARPATLSNAELIDCGAYPALGPGDGEVRGDVLEVSEETLATADEIEGHPEFYTRRRTSVTLDDGSAVEAWVYWAPESLVGNADRRLIPTGDWFDRPPVREFPPAFELPNNPLVAAAFGRLEDAACSWLSSVRPDGRPHLVPMWHVVAGNRIYFVTPANAVKRKNIAENPHVVVSLPDPDDVVIVDGWAIEAPHVLGAVSPLMAEKYGWDPASDDASGEPNVVIECTPLRLRAWSDEHDHRAWDL